MSQKRILILGGGFGGLFTALDLGGAHHITLVSDEDHFTFTPMLYEYLSGEVEEWHIAPRYDELLDEDVRLVQGVVTRVDLASQRVYIENNQDPFPYDVLVLAVGGITNYAGVSGAAEYSIPFRKIRDADRLRQTMVEALDRVPPDLPPQDIRQALTFAVVGGGASGVELSTKMADLLRDACKRRNLRGEPRVIILEMGDKIVPGMGEPIREFVEQALTESRVEVQTLTRVVKVSEKTVTLEHSGNQEEIETAAVVWVGGVRVSPLLDQLEVAKTRTGLLKIRPTLQLHEHDNVFVLGDIAYYSDASPVLAGTAQLAFQEAGLAARNIKAFLSGEELHTKHFAELGETVSLGTEKAAVLTGGNAVGGTLARQARFALYTARLPTSHHRLRVGASWFFE
jgi:NADH:ubiquinone reductase (non-electrogenic)